MADVKRVIDIVFRGSNQTTEAIRSIRTSIGGLGKGLGVLATAATAAAGALAAVGYKASREMAEGLASAYQEFATFQSSLKDLEKVLGAHPEKLEKAKTAAHEMAVEYGVSSTKILDSIGNWVQAGYDLDESMQLASDAIAAAYASELDMQGATEVMVKMLKGFGIEAGNARRKLDSLNALQNNYATSTDKLGKALAEVAPAASEMGFSLEEIAAEMVPTIEKFQDGKKAGTAWKTMLSKLANPMGQTVDGLKALGLKQEFANNEFDNGKEALNAIKTEFQKLTDKQKATVAAQIAGREHFTKLMAAFTEGETTTQALKDQMGAAGSVTDEMRRKMDSAEGQMSRFQAASEALSQIIGEQVASSFTNVVNSAADLTAELAKTIDQGGAEEFFESINSMANDFADYLDKISKVLPKAFDGVDWSSLASAFESVGSAFADWFKNVDLTTVEGMESAIQDMADGTATLVEFFGKLVAMVDDVAKFGTTMAGVANAVIENTTATKDAKYAVRDLGVAMGEKAASQAEVLSDALAYAKRNTSGAKDELDKFNAYLNANVKSTHKSRESLSELQNTINTLTGRQLVVEAKADEQSARDAGEEVKDSTPDSVKVKAEAEVKQSQIEKEIAKIETEAETAQTAIEMQAKVDIAEAEAAADKVEAAFSSVTETIKNTGSSITDLWGKALGSTGTDRFMIESQIRELMSMREESHNKQMRMLEEQIQMMRERRQQMEKGEPVITVNGDGLQPHLESVMWEILQEVQVKVNQEGMDMLMGT